MLYILFYTLLAVWGAGIILGLYVVTLSLTSNNEK
jgi:hypothetical protein